MDGRENKKVIMALAAIGLIFLFTRLFLLTSVPRGLHVDEAGMAYDAFCLANYGTDRFLTYHPVYLTNYGTGQSAMYAYITAVFIKIIGFRPSAFRLPAVCMGAVTLIFGYLTGREILGRRAGVLLAGLIAVCPYFIMASRWGLDCNLYLGFFTMSVYLLILAVRKEKAGWFMLAGLSFGFTLYTYAVSFYQLPLFLALSFLYLLWNRKIKIRQIAAFAVPLALLAVPLLLFVMVNMGFMEPFTTPLFSVQKLEYLRSGEISLSNIPLNIGLLKMLLSADELPYNGFAQFGTMYYISVPFVLPGMVLASVRMVKSIQTRSYDSQTFITMMFWVIFVLDLLTWMPNINKSNAIYFPFAYFTAYAMEFLLQKLPRKRGLTVGIAAVYLIFLICFGKYYYFEYPVKVYPQYLFNDSLIPMLERIESEYPRGTARKIYIDVFDDNVMKPYIYTLIHRPIHPAKWLIQKAIDDSYDFYWFNMPAGLDEDGIYIMYSNWSMIEELEQDGFQYEIFNERWKIYSKE